MYIACIQLLVCRSHDQCRLAVLGKLVPAWLLRKWVYGLRVWQYIRQIWLSGCPMKPSMVCLHVHQGDWQPAVSTHTHTLSHGTRAGDHRLGQDMCHDVDPGPRYLGLWMGGTIEANDLPVPIWQCELVWLSGHGRRSSGEQDGPTFKSTSTRLPLQDSIRLGWFLCVSECNGWEIRCYTQHFPPCGQLVFSCFDHTTGCEAYSFTTDGYGIFNVCIHDYYYLLKAYSPVNHTGSPQGFSQVHVLHKSKYKYDKHLTNTVTNIKHIKQIWTYMFLNCPCVQ